MKIEERFIPPTPTKPEREIVLTLTEREAGVLAAMLGKHHSGVGRNGTIGYKIFGELSDMVDEDYDVQTSGILTILN